MTRRHALRKYLDGAVYLTSDNGHCHDSKHGVIRTDCSGRLDVVRVRIFDMWIALILETDEDRGQERVVSS